MARMIFTIDNQLQDLKNYLENSNVEETWSLFCLNTVFNTVEQELSKIRSVKQLLGLKKADCEGIVFLQKETRKLITVQSLNDVSDRLIEFKDGPKWNGLSANVSAFQNTIGHQNFVF